MFARPSFVRHFPFNILTCLSVCTCQRFDPRYTGVRFNPYVKNYDPSIDSFPQQWSYTTNEIRVMLEVTSTRFANVLTNDAGSRGVIYLPNDTYYHSDSVVYTAETAARINAKLGHKEIAVFQGVEMESKPVMTEMNLALECVEKANLIFPGTVEHIVVHDGKLYLDYDEVERALQIVDTLKKRTDNNIKLGVRMICVEDLIDNTPERNITQQKILWKNFETMVMNTDFLICRISTPGPAIKEGAKPAIDAIIYFIQHLKEKVEKTIHTRKAELMGEIMYATSGTGFWESVPKMKIFWEEAVKFASKNGILMFFFQAFDIPSDENPHFGWWTLTENGDSNNANAYQEKINDGKAQISGDSSTKYIVGFAVAFAVICLLSLSIVIFLARKKNQQVALSKEDIRQFLEGISGVDEEDNYAGNYAFNHPYDFSYEIDTNKLKIHYDAILGTGEFGCVFKATLQADDKKEEQVALKVSKTKCSFILKGMMSEIKTMIYVGSHPNVVKFVGAYTAELHKGIAYIAMELCRLGSLKDYLRSQEQMVGRLHAYANLSTQSTNATYANDYQPVSFRQLLEWSHEIASGMEYLGDRNVVHADLAARNVLLTAEKTAKLSDFGLSRRLYNYTYYVKSKPEPLPWRWMAIETLKWCEFSRKSDVWSFGITLWEMFTLGITPYPGLTWSADFVNKLVDGMRLVPPTHISPELHQLMISCWHTEPNERPSFTEIKQTIKNIAQPA